MTSQALDVTTNQSVGIVATLSRSQMLQFLNGESSPPLNLRLSTRSINTPEHTTNTVIPVMHPNLVHTLKTILSAKTDANSSEDSGRSGARPDNPQLSEKENTLGVTDHYNRQASPESDKQDAMVIPVDLIENRRPYQCPFAGCQRTFKNPQTMRMHHKTHFCDALGAEAAFLASQPGSPLRAGHNKKIASRCPTCHRTFVGLYELRRHYGRKHSAGEKRHACRKCAKRFHVEVDVRDHEKLCGTPIACKCGLTFAFKCNLVAHKKTHPQCQEPAPSAMAQYTPIQSSDAKQGERRVAELDFATSSFQFPLSSTTFEKVPSDHYFLAALASTSIRRE